MEKDGTNPKPVSKEKSSKKTSNYNLSNEYLDVEIGEHGEINSLYIQNDLYPTNYMLNAQNSGWSRGQGIHQWTGDIMFVVKGIYEENSHREETGRTNWGRSIIPYGDSVVVTYENSPDSEGINYLKIVETYHLEGNQLKWNIEVTNTTDQELEILDFGLPVTFNEIWPGGEEIYETRVVDHSFVGGKSSYIYATRPSGQGQFMLLTIDQETEAKFEYQDHWMVQERRPDEMPWCQDQDGWQSGLSVFYIYSRDIKKTRRGYLGSTSTTFAPNETRNYGLKFTPVENEQDMKSTLYAERLFDMVAVPGMAFNRTMPAKMYIHTPLNPGDDQTSIHITIKCPHELYRERDLFTKNRACTHTETKEERTKENTFARFVNKKTIDGEDYYVYELGFGDIGQNDVIVEYEGRTAEYQFYIMDDANTALNTHSSFMVDNTQWNDKGHTRDQVFDDWMMDIKTRRGEFYGYWGWGDDWGLTHGEYLAEKNVYVPIAKEIEALDRYLDVAIWNKLMETHHTDYLIPDFLMFDPNTTPIYRGYAYAHIYNTYYSMYKIAKRYPVIVKYIENKDTYLMRACNILKAYYAEGVGYNWGTGIMGELTTPYIIQSLKDEGHLVEADEIVKIMRIKYNNFKYTKYPYGSEYSYDNTGEESVYTLAKMQFSNPSERDNALTMMRKIDLKTRACRGLQPVWYHYANPTTICGEAWWNFQYTAALAGYCMDDFLRIEPNGFGKTEKALNQRVCYAAKLANLTSINSGQIDSDPENIGCVGWTYQSEMGNVGAKGTGGGNIHNGWRQMSGEADLGLFGALQILSSDIVINDPVFGLVGYGCVLEDLGYSYHIIPKDGLFTRFNFIDDKLYLELDRDQYREATVSKDKKSIKLEIKNIEGTKHNVGVKLTGLPTGVYNISSNGKVLNVFNVAGEQPVTTSIPLQQGSQSTILIEIVE